MDIKTFSKIKFSLKFILASCLALLICSFVLAQNPTPTPLNPNLPSIFVVGDSTANNHANGGLGWGDPFIAYFDTGRVNVVNRARAGRSSRTFQAEGLWDKVLSEIKAGDVVLIQFGHNDGGSIDQPPARGSLPGLGEETKIVTKADASQETVHTFGWYMRKYVADTKAKGATPVILSLTVRNIWKDEKVERGSGQFSVWAATIAQLQQTEFIDLTTIIADKYEKIGQEKVKELFGPDHTHTSPSGAELNASLVVAGLKTLRNCLMCSYFSDKGKSVPAATVSGVKPRRPLPEANNPKLPTLFLIGDSTVRNGKGDGGGGQWGWGEPLADFFDPAKINVVNRAVGGLSSRTYLSLGYWEEVTARLKPGDFVMIQFGHNDGGSNVNVSRLSGSFKGAGEESEEFYNTVTKITEVVHTYGWYLRKYIAETKAKGATPIVCSLIPRKIWKDHKTVRNSEDYGKWAAETAKSQNVGFIDLNELIAAKYDELGEEKVEPLFADPHTHTSRAGAELNATIVINGLNRLKRNPLSKFYSDKGKSLGK